MNSFQTILLAASLFLCLWTATLARLKGYSAVCWLLGGGVIGVLVLCQLPPADHREPKRQWRGNRLGLLMSSASLAIVWLVREFLK